LRRKIQILYEDEYLLIVNKPPHILVQPPPLKTTLTDIINREYKKGSQPDFLPCHRLDKETSGAIIYAKTKECASRIMQMFKQRKIKKTYIGFVQGVLSPPRGRISFSLYGKKASTSYKVLKQYKDFCIVEIKPLTGRKNQIRLHFKRMGHPLVGESKFSFRRDFPLKFKRVCLHAWKLEFNHPFLRKMIKIQVGLWPDLRNFLKKYLLKRD